MEASDEKNVTGEVIPGTATTSASVNGSASGKGDFSLKPAGRKKKLNTLVIVIVLGGLVLAVLLIGLLVTAVLHHPDGETVVDETKVKPAPLLQEGRTQDNGLKDMMDHAMEEKKKDEAAQAPGGNTKPTPTQTENSSTPSSTGTSSVVVTPTSANADASQQPVQHEEAMFTPISRFDSAGMSNGSNSGGGGGVTTTAAGGNDQEGKLRAFISADPNEMARNLVNGSGGAGGGAGGLTGNGGGTLLDNLSGTQYATTQARRAPPGKFRLKKYTSFQCTLITGIKTDYPGFTKCTLTMPLYSADGSVILARAGAELRGEQKVEVRTGQSSVFTSWTELETPTAGNGPSVLTQLNGLGTDAMGRSGTDAEIDNHWGQKVGGALMLSLFKDTTSNFAKRASGSSGDNNYGNTESTTEDMASKVLDANINIAPTGYVKPGTVINVIVAQDIDFSSVYTTRN